MQGKCPKCEKPVMQVAIADVPARAFMGRTEWKGISFNCPMCQTILGVQIDPIAIKTDILNELKGSRW
jgi:endogenous inhibitor of DNA gyrase (YacG/DUF329 family)